MTVQLTRRRFTVHDYYLMAKAGILHEDDRVELIQGEIVEMTPIGSLHSSRVDKLNRLFSQRLDPAQYIIRVQQPVRLDPETEPQPDIVVVRYREDFYRLRHPGPDEALLFIEVAESSLAYDREIKVPLYARAGVPEVWLVDLAAAVLHVYRRPSGQGYETHFEVSGGNILTADGLPGLFLRPDDILRD